MMKTKYKIVIEETVDDTFEVFADSAEDAMKIAETKYRSGEFILEPGFLTSKQMCVITPEDELTEWIEF